MDPKYGEIKCENLKIKGKFCKNGAYYKCSTGKKGVHYLCGVHSKKLEREELKEMTKKEKHDLKMTRLKQMAADAAITAVNSSKPEATLVKMEGMFPFVPIRSGWINVYPNFKSSWQGVGFVCPALSPMSLGPVNHGQPGLPPSKTIENFHQFSKFFGKLENKKEFKERQIDAFKSPIPHRHKFPKDVLKKVATGNVNIPDYFVWIDKSGKEHHLTYIESRQFYCNFYERLVVEKKEYKCLQKLYNMNVKLQICGPDAYGVSIVSKNGIEEEYLNPKVPFGHERVLLTILTLEPEDYPWRKYKTFEF